jgi:inhibitor of KinA
MKAARLPFGDSAILVQLGDEIDLAINARVHALDVLVTANPLPGVVESVPAYASLLVHYDPLVLTYSQISDWLAAKMDQIETQAGRPPRSIEVPVRYGGQRGMDLAQVAAERGLSAPDVVRLHTGRQYTVYMMGFTPGFAYMGRLDDALATPRLPTPRPHVDAGSVGIAGAQTGIYPIESPGGWRLIGWTALQLFDPGSAAPFLFAPGDRVRFMSEGLDA